MPSYKVTSPSGKSLTITGQKPPSEAELNSIFSKSEGKGVGLPAKKSSSFDLGKLVAGPVGRGLEYKAKGINIKDVPHIASKAGSGYLMGVPEMAARNPVSGLPGMGYRIGSSIVGAKHFNEPSVFPEASSEGGKLAGQDAEILAGFVEGSIPRRAVEKATSIGKTALKTAVDEGKKEIPKRAKELGADKLVKKIKEIKIPLSEKELKRNYLKGVADKSKVYSNLENVTRRTAQKESSALKNTVKQETETMVRKLNSTARDEALSAQKELPKYYKKHFDAYEAAQDALIAKGKPASRNEVSRALETTLNELGLRGEHARPPSSPSESYLLDLASEYADITRHKELVPPEVLINLNRQVKGTLPSGVKSGSNLYGAGEHAVTVFKENFGKTLESKVKGLAELNAKYSKFFNLKRESNRIFKPYAGKYGTKTAEQTLKRSGLPRNTGTVEDVFLRDLQEEVGKPIFEGSRSGSRNLYGMKDVRESGLDSIAKRAEQRLIELGAKKSKVDRKSISSSVIGNIRKYYRYGTGRV